MNSWLNPLLLLTQRGKESVLVSIVEALGSTPRELGTKMIVTDDDTFATIGGGQFEYNCILFARELLRNKVDFTTKRFSLGPSLGQCCGGAATVSFDRIAALPEWLSQLSTFQKEQQPVVLASVVKTAAGTTPKSQKFIIGEHDVIGDTAKLVLEPIVAASRQLLGGEEGAVSETFIDATGEDVTLLLEPFCAPDFNLMLFGAGHVGRAVVRVLAESPCQITWVDSRRNGFPDDIPANVTCVTTVSPEYEVDEAPAGAYFLVMTHSHPLDQAICERILNRDDFRYCGLIGSISKRKKFEKRFRAAGISKQTCSKLTCPVGIAGISGKHPTEIAVSIAAELLQLQEQSAQVVKEHLLAS
ncbi:MAG: xanthine dehydrogenase accessory protein XdhC [Arenicellales bacterium]|nr:xanthine dehydrogenase accessory protein XdhC [Arenicellales bacterium]